MRIFDCVADPNESVPQPGLSLTLGLSSLNNGPKKIGVCRQRRCVHAGCTSGLHTAVTCHELLRNEGSFHKPAQTLLVVIRQAASFLNQGRERIPPGLFGIPAELVKLSCIKQAELNCQHTQQLITFQFRVYHHLISGRMNYCCLHTSCRISLCDSTWRLFWAANICDYAGYSFICAAWNSNTVKTRVIVP